jgi:hypothetical protein
MTLKATRLFGSVASLALGFIFLASAESCLGQSEQPSPPSNLGTPPPPTTGDASTNTTRGGLHDNDAANSADRKTRTTVDKGRSLQEEMIVIDAPTRQKQREREMAQHDRTFDSSILDIGVDELKVGKAKAKPEAKPSAKPIPSASPVAKPSITPEPVSSPNPDLGADTPLSLEVVPTLSSSKPSPSPSATASPHD